MAWIEGMAMGMNEWMVVMMMMTSMNDYVATAAVLMTVWNGEVTAVERMTTMGSSVVSDGKVEGEEESDKSERAGVWREEGRERGMWEIKMTTTAASRSRKLERGREEGKRTTMMSCCYRKMRMGRKEGRRERDKENRT